MNFLKNALTHWHTSVAGIAAGALVVAQSYKAGMTWKQWALAAAFAFFGLGASDGAKVVTKTALVILLFAMPAMAQAPLPDVPVTHVSISASFNGYDSNGKYVPATVDTLGVPIARNAAATQGFDVDYLHISVPSLGQRWEMGTGCYWLSLPKIKGILIDTSTLVSTTCAGAGKLLSVSDGNRLAWTVSQSITYPIAGHMGWTASYNYLQATGGIRGVLNKSYSQVGTGPQWHF